MTIMLSKTDFKEYLICPKWLWVKKRKPELYKRGEMSLFLEKLIVDGYEVEEYAQKLFPGGVAMNGDLELNIYLTQKSMKEHRTIFQAVFQTEDGLFAKIDVLYFNSLTSKWDIYEIKASSEIKEDLLHNHIKDITFQTIVAEKAGVSVGQCFIIHINKEYRRSGKIEPLQLFITEDVTEAVNGKREETLREIEEALLLLNKDEVSLDGCDCLYRSHGQRCDCFELFNPQVPKYSVHHIVSGKKLHRLLTDNILDIREIPDDFDLTEIQREKVVLQKSGKPLINSRAIKETLSKLVFPLYFLDYETYGKPYPVLDGYKANQQIVFQCSIHKVGEDGKIEHFEYLGKDFETATAGLLAMMKEIIGVIGNIVVWNECFEKGRNIELAEIHPEYSDFLANINSRIYDLMRVFKTDYLHPNFRGSASLKRVLPVLLPEFSYKDLEIQDGTMALSEWEKTTRSDIDEEEKEEIRQNLLKYCNLDTLAMVEIWRILSKF